MTDSAIVPMEEDVLPRMGAVIKADLGAYAIRMLPT